MNNQFLIILGLIFKIQVEILIKFHKKIFKLISSKVDSKFGCSSSNFNNINNNKS